MSVARHINISFFGLTCLLWGMLLASSAAAEWEVVTQNRRDYVTLESLCRFYGFNYLSTAFDQSFSARNKDFALQIPRSDSREIRLNGVNYWLSFPVSTNSKDWLISRADVAGLIEPILRPHKIDGSLTVRGVVIDPGHGGSDNGARNSKGNFEKTYTLDTSLRLEKLLKEGGIKTVLTRRSDIFIPLEERVSIAARYKDYLFVSVHFNYAHRSARR
jgi:N-acetylmuramoyl-L-alanine amidase